jgi:Transcriptional Coactivator p15 (PC4)
MWTKPGYTPPRPAAPPQENGRRLATFSRGPRSEYRVNLCEYEGHPYISVRQWVASGGAWYPDEGVGISIRLHEAEGFVKAIRLAVAMVEGGRPAEAGGEFEPVGNKPDPHRDDPDRPRFVDRRRRPQPRPIAPPAGMASSPSAEQFDEFAEGDG